MITNDSTPTPHYCAPENAAKFFDWLTTRGGLAIWRSVDLSNPGQTWTTPANDTAGNPTTKPTWRADSKPFRIITDPDVVVVCFDREVKRFRVAIRRSSNGLAFKCTDASSRKIRAAVAAAGPLAYHAFDYMTQEAVIFAPDRKMSLREWKEAQSYPQEEGGLPR